MTTITPVNIITLDEAKVGDVLIHEGSILDFAASLVYKVDKENQVVYLARPYVMAHLSETLAPVALIGVEDYNVPMSYSMVRIGTGHKLSF
jgi:hypothetical protein